MPPMRSLCRPSRCYCCCCCGGDDVWEWIPCVVSAAVVVVGMMLDR